MTRELDNMARLFEMAVEYKKKIGFPGQLYIEPKPMEPTKHQYDSDAEATLNFLRKYRLLKDFKLNLEFNHATLAGHDMIHEVEVAGAAKALGSIDANCGDPMLGWDVDLFNTNVAEIARVMYGMLKFGGFTTGGVNFDARVRRESTDPVDLFHGHISSMDAFARGLKIAAAMRRDRRLAMFIRERYASWDQEGLPSHVRKGQASLDELEAYVMQKGGRVDVPPSGRQELLEGMLNEYLH
jgi:xylose isomerase